ncbi:unnamed protein product [Spodoptera exigua]|nr:unnamed protein product [Spodoptera exigua]
MMSIQDNSLEARLMRAVYSGARAGGAALPTLHPPSVLYCVSYTHRILLPIYLLVLLEEHKVLVEDILMDYNHPPAIAARMHWIMLVRREPRCNWSSNRGIKWAVNSGEHSRAKRGEQYYTGAIHIERALPAAAPRHRETSPGPPAHCYLRPSAAQHTNNLIRAQPVNLLDHGENAPALGAPHSNLLFMKLFLHVAD